MTGANAFTRAAGAIGLLGLPLGFVAQVVGRRHALHHPFDPPGGLYWLVVLAAIGCMLTLVAGLLVRHRDAWWVLPVAGLLGLAVFASIAPGDGAGKGITAAAWIVLAAGIAHAGVLPRHAAAAVLVSSVGEVLSDRSLVALVSALVGMYGFAVLAGTMWREPDPSARERMWEGSLVVRP